MSQGILTDGFRVINSFWHCILGWVGFGDGKSPLRMPSWIFRCRIFEGRNNHLPLNETSLSYKLRLVGVFRKDLTFGLKAAFSWNPNLVDKHPHVQYFGNKAFIFICNRKARQHVRTWTHVFPVQRCSAPLWLGFLGCQLSLISKCLASMDFPTHKGPTKAGVVENMVKKTKNIGVSRRCCQEAIVYR
jgi:hypothetical protein